MTTWHDIDIFWKVMEPIMFTEERLERTPEEVDKVVALLELEPGARVLDMGCGPGRHSLELTRRGYNVTGVDRTTFFLDKAIRRADDEGLEVEFIQGDMQEYQKPNTYDVVLSLYTSFSYFETHAENERVLKNLSTSLKEGGKLIIEMMGKEVLARIFTEKGWEELDDTFYLQERKVSKNWSWMENRWIKIQGSERHEYMVSHWVYAASELEVMLNNSGFRSVTFYGGLDGEPYDQHAMRLIAVAIK